MIKITNVDVTGWEAAIRGMRNPLNSWEHSDSEFHIILNDDSVECQWIGQDDLKLMKKLAAAGSDHAKYRRMITVTADIEAPLYWWKEYDTYKVGTVANSCSTMHTLHKREIKLSDFSWENVPWSTMWKMVEILNYYRERYLATKEKEYWRALIQLLPSSYNQLRTVQLNYEVLANIYRSRKNHKLDEWHTFCAFIEQLPYSEIITA